MADIKMAKSVFFFIFFDFDFLAFLFLNLIYIFCKQCLVEFDLLIHPNIFNEIYYIPSSFMDILYTTVHLITK